MDQFVWHTCEMWGQLIDNRDLMVDVAKVLFLLLAEGYLPPSIQAVSDWRLSQSVFHPPFRLSNDWRLSQSSPSGVSGPFA